MIYRWKPGSHLSANAQAVGERLALLEHEHHGLTADVALDDARNPASALHPIPEWDDAVAAEAHRLEQMRHALRSVVVRVGKEEEHEVRAFVLVSENEEQHYSSIVRVMSDAVLRAQTLQRAMRELEQWRARYHEYEELATIFKALKSAPMPVLGTGGRKRQPIPV